ncbi:hypothetical protein AAHC03_09943 [Spirometra sp. Aus1]
MGLAQPSTRSPYDAHLRVIPLGIHEILNLNRLKASGLDNPSGSLSPASLFPASRFFSPPATPSAMSTAINYEFLTKHKY